MKKLIICTGLILYSALNPASAVEDWWGLSGYDYYVGNAGDVCYTDTDEYVVYSCECDWDVDSPYTNECPGDPYGTRECQLQGRPATGYARFCMPGNTGYSACEMCGCGGTTSWVTYSSTNHTVSRTIHTATSSNYLCTSTSSVQYGCAAGYYRKSGSGASMVCTPCPEGGASNVGNTLKTGCYLPTGTTFSDDLGSGIYGKPCYYSES